MRPSVRWPAVLKTLSMASSTHSGVRRAKGTAPVAPSCGSWVFSFMPALGAAPPSMTGGTRTDARRRMPVALRRHGQKRASVHLRAGRADLLARVDQIFEKEGFGIELQRCAGFTGVPRHHRHVAENSHDDAARALGHGDMHGSDDRTDLHDVSPFSLCRLVWSAGQYGEKSPATPQTLRAHLNLHPGRRGSYDALFPFFRTGER